MPLVSGLHKQGAASDLSQGRLSGGECIPQPPVGLHLICSFPKAKRPPRKPALPCPPPFFLNEQTESEKVCSSGEQAALGGGPVAVH